MISCSNCGHRNLNDARACTECGNVLNTEQNELDQVESIAIKPATTKPDALQQPEVERPPQHTDASLSDSTVQPSEQSSQPGAPEHEVQGRASTIILQGAVLLFVFALVTFLWANFTASRDGRSVVVVGDFLGGAGAAAVFTLFVYRLLRRRKRD